MDERQEKVSNTSTNKKKKRILSLAPERCNKKVSFCVFLLESERIKKLYFSMLREKQKKRI